MTDSILGSGLKPYIFTLCHFGLYVRVNSSTVVGLIALYVLDYVGRAMSADELVQSKGPH